EHGDLAVEAYARTRHEGFTVPDASAVDRVACREVVSGVHHNVGLIHHFLETRPLHPFGDCDDLHLGIDARERPLRGRDFLCTDGIGVVDDLALEVGQIYLVVIAQGDAADAAGCTVE